MADLAAAINAGANSGGGAGPWTGNGITSSTAVQDPGHYGVGIFDNALLGLSSVGGQSVEDGSIVIAVAHLGDVNRNGVVDIQDQSIVTNHWQYCTEQLGGGGFEPGRVSAICRI